jgi:hypothetical protein
MFFSKTKSMPVYKRKYLLIGQRQTLSSKVSSKKGYVPAKAVYLFYGHCILQNFD